jgi:hypothetical protein
MRTVACFAVVALHAVANSLRDDETATVMDCRGHVVNVIFDLKESKTNFIAVTKDLLYFWPKRNGSKLCFKRPM